MDAALPNGKGTHDADTLSGMDGGLAVADADLDAHVPLPVDDCGLKHSAVPAVWAEIEAADLAVDDKHLYVAATSSGICAFGSSCTIQAGDLVRMPRCGGAPEVAAAGAQAALLVDAGAVLYFQPTTGAGLVRVDKQTLPSRRFRRRPRNA